MGEWDDMMGYERPVPNWWDTAEGRARHVSEQVEAARADLDEERIEANNRAAWWADKAHRAEAAERALVERAAQQILNTVDPIGPSHEIRMRCVEAVRALARPDADLKGSPRG